jgi:16S rRNA (uracil1498-N3)-methyltransferase
VQRERRLFCDALPPQGGEVILDEVAVRHARVLRLGPGDPILLFDGQGHEARGSVRAMEGGRIVCDVERPAHRPASSAPCVLVLGLPKAGKLDAIVRMVTEAGASAVHLADTGRAVARFDPARASARMQRLARVATEAARQAGRADVPELRPPRPLAEVVAQAPPEARRLVAHPRATRHAWEVDVEAHAPTWIVVGPEGGFTDGEVGLLEDLGFVPVRLGPHVLRVETAAAVAVALAVGPARSR